MLVNPEEPSTSRVNVGSQVDVDNVIAIWAGHFVVVDPVAGVKTHLKIGKWYNYDDPNPTTKHLQWTIPWLPCAIVQSEPAM